MFSSAEKTIKPVTVVQQKTARTGFFRKAGEESYFGADNKPTFFHAPVQAKLSVSTPDDPHEKEADAVADRVMRMPEPVAVKSPPVTEEQVQRKDEQEEVQAKPDASVINKIQIKHEPEEKVQAKRHTVLHRFPHDDGQHKTGSGPETSDTTISRKNISLYHSDIVQRSGRGPPQTSVPFQENLSASKGAGSPLPGDTRMSMEGRFSADFSKVRVHTGSRAEEMSSQINAQAFTHGNDIYFNKGKYAPGSSQGDTLLAHELTHTVQQGASRQHIVSPKTNVQSTKIRSYTAVSINKKQIAPISTRPGNLKLIQASPEEIRGSGSSLSSEAREYFEDSFKTDVGDIRVHADFESAILTRSRRVPAFVEGRHIVFDPSRYAPDSEEGGILLAKLVAESLRQRSLGTSGMISQINQGIRELKTPGTPPGAKKPEGKDGALTKEKKKPGAKGKATKGSKEKRGGGKRRAKHKADKSDGPPLKAVKPNPKKSPSTPEEDPAFYKAAKTVKATAKKQKQHDPAELKASDAQKAALAVPNEAESKAQKRKTDSIDHAGMQDKPFDAKSFKTDLLNKIESITPRTLEEATEFKENNKVGEVKNVIGEKVSGEKQSTTGPVTQATVQPLQVNEADNKTPVPLPPTPKGARPAGPGAKDAAPKPKLNNEISLEEQSRTLDDEMRANNVTEEQLARSNEPSFTSALAEKKTAQKDATEKPLQYRKAEVLMLNEARSSAQQESARSMSGMSATRGKNLDSVVQHQQTTKQKDEERRANVTKEIEKKYADAEKKVQKALEEAETESSRIFDEGADAARKDFENYVAEKMSAYKRRRYSGFWGGLRWGKDKLFGMPDAVNVFYTQGRQLYLDKMDIVLTRVANIVTTKLNEAKQAIREGKKQIDDYVSQLPKDLEKVGKEAANDIQDKFDALEQSVNDKREQLIEGLSKKYVDNLKKLDERISEMKEANQGLIDKAIGFLKKVWKVIKDLTNLFMTIFSKLASIIGTILSDPGAFFDNLGKAFKLGFDNFKANFLEYLEQGLMEWLKTNLGIAGMEIPKKFSPAAIFGLALQVMGITKGHIRERAVVLLGDRKVKLLEEGGGLLSKINNEGLGAIWEMIYEKLSDFKEIIWEAIKSFIHKKVIEAALVFLLSMLNPIGAFIKVCTAIYDFLMMLVRFKDRIIELLDTILHAVTSIASGAVSGAAKAIEAAFAKSIPVIIGFLAALLRLNDISAKVRDIILRVQKRVEKAIDWVLHKAGSLLKKTAGLFGGKKGEPDGRTDEDKQKDLKAAVAEGNILLRERILDKKIRDSRLEAIKTKYSLKELRFVIDEQKEIGEKVHVFAEINPVIHGQRMEIDYDLVEREVNWPPRDLIWHENRGGHTVSRHIDPHVHGLTLANATREQINERFLISRIYKENTEDPRTAWRNEGAARNVVFTTIEANRTSLIKWLVYNDPNGDRYRLEYRGSQSNVLGIALMEVDNQIHDFEVWHARIVLKKVEVNGQKSFIVLTAFPE